MFNFDKVDKDLLFILIGVFILTEIVDVLFDHLLGTSILHSVVQLFLFIVLFLIVTKIFLIYNKKINALVPDELMAILRAISAEKEKGVLVNQAKLMKLLDVTKPTMKKRLDQLERLGYVSFEEEGNNKYVKLTSAGNSLVK